MSLVTVTEIDRDIWYVFYMCICGISQNDLLHFCSFHVLGCGFCELRRLRHAVFCGEMVMIAKAKAVNFQDILQLAPCFFSRSFSEKSVSELHPFHSCVFQSHSKDSIFLHYGHMLSSDFWSLCEVFVKVIDDVTYDYTTHFHMFSLLKQPGAIVILYHFHFPARETTNIWTRLWLNHERFYSLLVC